MRLAEIMTTDVQCVSPDSTISEAAEKMERFDVGSIPVEENGRPVGVITDRDIAVRVAAKGRDAQTTRVRDIMTRNVVCCRQDEDLEDAAEVMEQRQIRRLLVVDDNGNLTGIVSLGDIALRSANDILSEDVLEEVSWPGHPRGVGILPTQRHRLGRIRHSLKRNSGRIVEDIVSVAAGAAVGAALMYLFDPSRGVYRRERMKGQMREGVERARDAGRDIADRARHAGEQAREYARDAKDFAREKMGSVGHGDGSTVNIPRSDLPARSPGVQNTGQPGGVACPTPTTSPRFTNR